MRPLARLRAVYFAAFASLGIFMPYLTLYLRGRGVRAEDIAWMLAVVPLARVFTPPLLGWLADRLGSPVLVLRGVAVGASASALAYLGVTGPTGLFGALFAQGVMHASIFPMLDAAGLAILVDEGGDFGEVRSFGSVGFIFGVLLGGVLWSGPGLAWAPLGLALTSLGVAATAFALPARRPADHRPPRLADVGELLRVPGFAAVLVVAFLHEAVICGYDLFFALHVEALGLSTQVTGCGWAAGVLCEVALLRRGSRLMSRLGARGMMLAGIGLAAIRWTLVGLASTPEVLIPLQGLHAFTFGAWFLGTITSVEKLAPARLRGTAQGLLYSSLFGLGVASGARLWGGLVATRGTAFTFQAMGAAELLALAAGALLLPEVVRVPTAPPPQEGSTGAAG